MFMLEAALHCVKANAIDEQNTPQTHEREHTYKLRKHTYQQLTPNVQSVKFNNKASLTAQFSRLNQAVQQIKSRCSAGRIKLSSRANSTANPHQVLHPDIYTVAFAQFRYVNFYDIALAKPMLHVSITPQNITMQM